MTDGTPPAPLDPALAERAAARRASAGKRGHAAAATRLFVGGVALAGTFQMVAAMGEPVGPVEDVALPTSVVNGTVPVAPTTTSPPPAPRTIVVGRRPVVVAGSSSAGSVTSTRTAAPVAASPAPRAAAPTPAPPPAPAPVTTSKGS